MKQLINNSIWALHPDYLSQLDDIKISVDMQTAEEMQAALKRATSFRNVKGRIVILPLSGYIGHRATLFNMIFGTSTEMFGRWFDEMMADDSIGAIIIDVNSPGGSVAGTQELADKIFAARGQKPIIAVVNSLMASAAYWIGSAADEIIMTPSGEAGSIGVVMVHTDISEAAKQAGFKYTIIRSGEHKYEGNMVEPLSEDAVAYLQGQCDTCYESFLAAVARHRGATVSKIKADFGQGRCLMAKAALAAGMIDRIATMDQVIADLFPKDRKQGNNALSAYKTKLEIAQRR